MSSKYPIFGISKNSDLQGFLKGCPIFFLIFAAQIILSPICLGQTIVEEPLGQRHALTIESNANDYKNAMNMEGVSGFVGGRTAEPIRKMLVERVSQWSADAIFDAAKKRGMVNERGEIDLRRILSQSDELKEEVKARLKNEIKQWLPGAVRDLIKEQVFQGALGEEGAKQLEGMLDKICDSFDKSIDEQIDGLIGKWYDEGIANLKMLLAGSKLTSWIDPTKLKESFKAEFSSSTVIGGAGRLLGMWLGDATVQGIREYGRMMMNGELPPEVTQYLNLPGEKLGELKDKIKPYMPGELYSNFMGSVLRRPLFRMHSGAYGAILAAQAARHFANAYKGVFVDANELRRGIEVTRVMIWQLKEKEYLNVSLMDMASLGKGMAFSVGAENLYARGMNAVSAPLDKLRGLTDKIDGMINMPLDKIGAELKKSVDEVTTILKGVESELMAPFKDGMKEFDALMARAGDGISKIFPENFDGIPASWDEFKDKIGAEGGLGALGGLTPRGLMEKIGVMDDLEMIRGDLADLNDRLAGGGAAAAADIIDGLHLAGPAAVIMDVEKIPAINPSDSNSLDPVLLHNGEFVHSATDFVIPGRGIDLKFTRIYRSRSDFLGAFGRNWTHSYAERLMPWKREDGSGWTYVRPDGMKFFFLEKKDGTYASPDGIFLILARTKEGFVLRDPQGNETEFYFLGLLKEKRDTFGNKIRFMYDDDGRLEAIIDAMRRPVVIRYNDDGLIAQIEDVSGRVWQYSYDGEKNLVGATSPSNAEFPLGKTTAYAYSGGYGDEELNHNLVGIVDPKGSLYLRNVYGVSGANKDRVVEQRYGGRDQRVHVAYGEAAVSGIGANQVASRAWVTDRRGVIHVYEHNSAGQILNEWISSADYEPSLVRRFVYDDVSRETSSCLPSGRCVEYEYDDSDVLAMGDVLTLTDRPSGSGSLRVTRIGYDKRFHKPETLVDPLKNEWSAGYGSCGELEYSCPSSGDENKRVCRRYAYDNFGRIVSVEDERGVVTKYEYHRLRGSEEGGGYLKRIVFDAEGKDDRKAYGEPKAASISLAYDDVGNIISETDAAGFTTTFRVNVFNQIERETGADGTEKKYEFDANDNLVRIEISKDAEKFVRAFEYDPLDRLVLSKAFVDAEKTVETRYEYDSEENLVRVIKPEGNEIKIERDNRGRALCISRGEAGECRKFDEDGNVASISDAEGFETGFSYDGFGGLSTVAYPNGTVERATRDIAGRIVSHDVVDGNGGMLAGETLKYDEEDNVSELRRSWWRDDSSDVSDAVHRMEYDGLGNVVLSIDPMGNETRFRYDGLGFLGSVQDAMGNVVRFERDGKGKVAEKVIEERLPDGTVRESRYGFAYDQSGNLISITDPLGAGTAFAYNAIGDMILKTDALGNSVRYETDGLGRVASIVERADRQGPEIVTRYVWDGNGRLSGIADAKGNVTRFGYDDSDRLVEEIFPDGKTVKHFFNKRGDEIRRIDGAGNEFDQRFDPMRMMSERIVSGAARPGEILRQRFAYDGMGRLISAVDEKDSGDGGDDVASYFSYDSLGNAVAEATGGRWISKSFDALGNLSAVLYPSGMAVYYARDPVLRISKIFADKAFVSYRYDGLNRSEAAFGNGIRTRSEYDALGRVTERRFVDKNGAQIDRLSYRYDAGGNLIEEDRDASKVKSAYFYDGLARLVRADIGGRTLGYDMDSLGNWIATSDGGKKIEWKPDETNAYTEVKNEDSAVSFEYDSNGNLTFDGSRRYRYDAMGRLVEVRNSDGSETGERYVYDALGRRVRIERDGKSFGVAYDGWREAEIHGDGAEYELLNGDALDARVAVVRGSKAEYYHSDRIGSVIGVSNEEGLMAQAFRYDPYGRRYSLDIHQMETGGDRSGIDFAFTGRVLDATGLMNYRNRYYHPLMGRFVSPDPIGYKIDFHARTSGVVPLVGSYHDLFGLASQTTMPNRSLNDSGLSAGAYPFKRFFEGGGAFSRGETNLYLYAGANPLVYIDPLGLARLVFDRSDEMMTVEMSDGFVLAQFHAANRTTNPNANPLAIGANGPVPNGSFPLSQPEFRTRRIRENFYDTYGLDEGSYWWGESSVTGAWAASPHGQNDAEYNISQGNIRFRIGGAGAPRGSASRTAWNRALFIHGGRNDNEKSKTYGCIRARDSELDYLAVLSITLYEEGDPLNQLVVQE